MHKITLQVAYLRFVNFYGGCKDGVASKVFIRLSDIRRVGLLSPDRNALKLASKEERKNIEKETTRNLRLKLSLEQFGLMLTEYSLPLWFSDGEQTIEIPSKEIFEVPESIQTLLDNEFETFYGKSISLSEADFRHACHRFFSFGEDQDSTHEQKTLAGKIIQNPKASCYSDLFNKNNKGMFDPFEKFPRDDQFQEDGEVSVFLQNTYHMSANDVNRHLLPLLKSLRH